MTNILELVLIMYCKAKKILNKKIFKALENVGQLSYLDKNRTY